MGRKSLQAGLCNYPDDGCAFEKTECSDNNLFRSSRQMQGAPDRAHGGECLLQESIRGKVLGACVTQNDSSLHVCSPNESSCNGMNTNGSDMMYSFQDANSISDDKECLAQDTVFGSCNERCSWSSDSCLTNEIWSFPADGCNCDSVQVGACVKDGGVFCAVSPDGCDDSSYWLNPLEVISDTDVECFLCREQASGGSSTTLSTTNTLSTSSDATISSLSATESSSSSNIATVITATLGGVVGVCVISFLAIYMIRKRSRKANETVLTMKPPQSIMVM